MIAGWCAGHRKLYRFSLIEILNNAGGKVDTCGTSLVRQVDSTQAIAARWVWPASLHLPRPLMRMSQGTESGDEQKSPRLHLLFSLYLPDLSLARGGWMACLQKARVGCCLGTCASHTDGEKIASPQYLPRCGRGEDLF